jgi:hypothetical protein
MSFSKENLSAVNGAGLQKQLTLLGTRMALCAVELEASEVELKVASSSYGLWSFGIHTGRYFSMFMLSFDSPFSFSLLFSMLNVFSLLSCFIQFKADSIFETFQKACQFL